MQYTHTQNLSLRLVTCDSACQGSVLKLKLLVLLYTCSYFLCKLEEICVRFSREIPTFLYCWEGPEYWVFILGVACCHGNTLTRIQVQNSIVSNNSNLQRELQSLWNAVKVQNPSLKTSRSLCEMAPLYNIKQLDTMLATTTLNCCYCNQNPLRRALTCAQGLLINCFLFDSFPFKWKNIHQFSLGGRLVSWIINKRWKV